MGPVGPEGLGPDLLLGAHRGLQVRKRLGKRLGKFAQAGNGYFFFKRPGPHFKIYIADQTSCCGKAVCLALPAAWPSFFGVRKRARKNGTAGVNKTHHLQGLLRSPI